MDADDREYFEQYRAEIARDDELFSTEPPSCMRCDALCRHARCEARGYCDKSDGKLLFAACGNGCPECHLCSTCNAIMKGHTVTCPCGIDIKIK